jgi:N-methylhydantoinase A
LVLADAAAQIGVYKVPSIPGDPGRGVLNAIRALADDLGIAARTVLENCELFLHGSTIATNTVLEGRGAKVAMIATDGLRDSIEIRRGMRTDQWNHRAPYPPVLVPRHRRYQVKGRLDHDGNELIALDSADVRRSLAAAVEDGIEALAVCLINSYVNPLHEHGVASAAANDGFAGSLSVSSEICPIMGEFERFATTVLNAYIAPRVVAYLTALNDRLVELGLRRPMLLLQSNGGTVPLDRVAQRPIDLLLSGPAAGVGALRLYRDSIGSADLILIEIGGTSSDITLMSRGEIATTDELSIAGYHASVPSVDIHSVGTGGGTIAGVDSGGMLYVGPRGAGARPGPACYGLGGTQPTITDAQLVLGRLKPGPYAGGSISLDLALARGAIERDIAKPLGIAVEDAASGVIELAEQQLLQALERMSTERGYDARRFTLVAAGGAGPMHGAVVGRKLGCPRVYIPRLAGAFCALGMLNTHVRRDYVQSFFSLLQHCDPSAIEQLFVQLEARANDHLAASGFAPHQRLLKRELDMRYEGQQWSVRVGSPASGFDVRLAEKGFEVEHERLYGHAQPGGTVEITMLRLAAFGLLAPLQISPAPTRPAAVEPVEMRPVYVSAGQSYVPVPVYRGADLAPGDGFAGPALIEEQTTTVYLAPADQLTVDQSGNYVIELEAA